jgi:hypothetical protein
MRASFADEREKRAELDDASGSSIRSLARIPIRSEKN